MIGRRLAPFAAALLLGLACGSSSDQGNLAESSPSTKPCPVVVLATFPSDFPTYPGASILDERACTGFSNLPTGSIMFYRRWSTADTGQQVDDFYSARLNQGRWSVVKVYPIESDGSTSVDFAAKDDPNLDGSLSYAKVSAGGEIEVFIFISPLPSPSATSTPPNASAAPSAPAVNLCSAPANPWNYNFCAGTLIKSPPSDFCSYFDCIASFWNGVGYVVQCADGTYSKSGGRSGVCSSHGGFRRNLYAP